MARMGNYCRAYHARDFSAFPGWRPDAARLRPADDGAPREALGDDDLLYLQDDYTVTDGIFQDEHVVFAGEGDEWRAFCAGPLGFAPPVETHPEPAAPAA